MELLQHTPPPTPHPRLFLRCRLTAPLLISPVVRYVLPTWLHKERGRRKGGLGVNGREQRQWKGRWRSTLIVWFSRGINSHRWQAGSYSLTWEGSEEAIKTTPGTDSQHIKRERDLCAQGSPSGRTKAELCEVGVLQNAPESNHLIEGNTFKCQRKHKLLYLNGSVLWGQKKKNLWLVAHLADSSAQVSP